MNPVGPQTHLVVVFPVPECTIGIDMLSRKQNPYVDFLTCGMKDIIIEKAKGMTLVLPLSGKIVNESNTSSVEGLQISAATKDLKDAGVMIPITSHAALLRRLCRRQTDPGEGH